MTDAELKLLAIAKEENWPEFKVVPYQTWALLALGLSHPRITTENPKFPDRQQFNFLGIDWIAGDPIDSPVKRE